ncbi:unnamed protein product, partial [Nesidiocoris tenuis]
MSRAHYFQRGGQESLLKFSNHFHVQTEIVDKSKYQFGPAFYAESRRDPGRFREPIAGPTSPHPGPSTPHPDTPFPSVCPSDWPSGRRQRTFKLSKAVTSQRPTDPPGDGNACSSNEAVHLQQRLRSLSTELVTLRNRLGRQPGHPPHPQEGDAPPQP